MAEESIPLPRRDPRSAETRFRRIIGQMEANEAERQKAREATRDLTGESAPVASVLREGGLSAAVSERELPAHRIFEAHAAFHPAASGRAIPTWPTDEDALNAMGARVLPEFVGRMLLRTKPTFETKFFPEGLFTTSPTEIAPQIRGEESRRSAGRVLRQQEEE